MKESILTGVLLLAGYTCTASAATWYFASTRNLSGSVEMTYSTAIGDEFTVLTGITSNSTRTPSSPNLTGLTCGRSGTANQGAAFWLDMEKGGISHIAASQRVDLYTQNSAIPGYTTLQSEEGNATAMFELNNNTAGDYSWTYSDNSPGDYDLKSGNTIYGKCGESWPNSATLLMKKTTVMKPGLYKFNVPLYYRITYSNNVGVSPIYQFSTVATQVTVNNTCNAAVGDLVYTFDKTNLAMPQTKSTSLSVTCDDSDTQIKFRIMAGDGSPTQTATDGSVVMTSADGLSGTMLVSVGHGSSTTINSNQWSNNITASTVSGLTSVMSIHPDVKAGMYQQTYQIQVAYD